MNYCSPMQGQANHFLFIAKEKHLYGIQRYVGETERLYSVLNTRLDGREYVAGPGKGSYSIADIALFGWANCSAPLGIDFSKDFPNIHAWWERVGERPAVKRGLKIPRGVEGPFNNKIYYQKLQDDPEVAQKAKESRELVQKAKEQYDYKFAPV